MNKRYHFALVLCNLLLATTHSFSQANGRGTGFTRFADQYIDISSAIDSCPVEGCIVYAGGPKMNHNLGTVDPRNKAVTLILGPGKYYFRQIVLRNSLHIQGSGSNDLPGTILQSIAGSLPAVVLGGMTPIAGVVLTNFRLYGADGNRNQNGLDIVAQGRGAGLWYSEFRDLILLGFRGVGINLDGSVAGTPAGVDQFLSFRDVRAFRNRRDSYALRIYGVVGQVTFDNCQFDGSAIGDGTNIWIGSRSSTSWPYSIDFRELTTQGANLGVSINGGASIHFSQAHLEVLNGGIQVNEGTGIGSYGVVVDTSYFAGTVGVDSGKGYLTKVTTTQADLTLADNLIAGQPDSVVDAVNWAQVIVKDNSSTSGAGALPSTGITPLISPDSKINIRRSHIVGLNSSQTPITTIQSYFMSGDSVTFFVWHGSASFATGGNLDLTGRRILTLDAPATASFVMNDLNGEWKLTSMSSNNWNSGEILISSASRGSQNFQNPFKSVPLCVATPASNPGSTLYWVTSTSAEVTVNLSEPSSIAFDYQCRGNPN
jgi:hypothetical protein